jgi:hypothetical protein
MSPKMYSSFPLPSQNNERAGVFSDTRSLVLTSLAYGLVNGTPPSGRGTYHCRADGTWSCHFADMIDGGRWTLRGDRTLDLTLERPHGKTTHEIIVVDRIVHETLYVRTKYQREAWLKQPGP